MKKIITIALIGLTMNVFGQAPNWAWAKVAGDTTDDQANTCCTDGAGNIIVAGCFSSSNITFGTTTLVNAGGWDIFIVKYDSNGNVLWAKGAGGFSQDVATSCTSDASGNIIVTGYFISSNITFGTTTLANASVSGYADIFIVKYDNNGNLVWATSAGGTGSDVPSSCTSDIGGDIIVTGSFRSSSINFGTTNLSNTSTGSDEIFTVKYGNNGNALWAKSAGGYYDDVAQSCSTDANGNIIVTGYFGGSTISFGTTILTGSDEIFIVKYDSNGNVLWAKSAGGNGLDQANSCSTDANGNIIVTGWFRSSSINFGITTIVNSNAPYGDMFIVKYDSNGSELWAKRAGGNQEDFAQSCSTDASGNIIAAGWFRSSNINFGTTTFVNANSPYADIFIVKYDSNGNVLWAKVVGGTNWDRANSCSTDAIGNIIVTGYFGSATISFGFNSISNSDTTSNTTDIFLAKVDNNCFAHYATTYDSISNNFSLTVNPATAAFAVSYHWDFGDGTTSTAQYPTHTYTVDTLYNVCMKIYTTTGDSCEYCHIIGFDTLGNVQRTPGFTINVINPATVSVKEIPKENTITISPNPFTSQTTITSTKNQIQSIKIMDVLGNEILSFNKLTSASSVTIDMSGYARGVYFIRIEDENKNVVNRKMVKN